MQNRLATIGYCIYCGSTQPPLTREHIIPEGLGGRDFIAEASCAKCQIITSKFEQQFLRGINWPARVKLGMRGRKRKAPPPLLPVQRSINYGERKETVMVPPDEVPVQLSLVTLEPPGLLCGKPEKRELRRTGYITVVKYKHVRTHSVGPGDSIAVVCNAVDTVRTAAKAAHAHCFAKGELVDFKPMLLDLIMSGDLNCSDVIGTPRDGEYIRPKRGVQGHLVESYRTNVGSDWFLVSRVTFFPAEGGPTYLIVVGKK